MAVGLAMAGFVAAIGILTLAFAPTTESYAPKGSADAAAWIQAIGSIGAILGAFLIGSTQASHARKLAFDLEERRRKDQVSRYQATVRVVHLMATTAIKAVREEEFNEFRENWNFFLRNDLRTALAAFDAMPAHELGDDQQLFQAFAVRTGAQRLMDAITQVCEATGLQNVQYAVLKSHYLGLHEVTLDIAARNFDAAWSKA